MVYEGDEWSTSGPTNFLSPDVLARIKSELERGPVIVEHWHYRGSRAPDRLVFEDFEDVVEYAQTKARPGDAFHVWAFAGLCRDENTLASGKIPDAQGRTPKRGAY